MSKPLRMQHLLPAPLAKVFGAFVNADALQVWFAEHAHVDTDQRRVDFWGRYTPETPNRAGGHHPITHIEPNRRLTFTWHLRGVDTTVDLHFVERGDRTLVALRHTDVPGIKHGEPGAYAIEDVWFLSFENSGGIWRAGPWSAATLPPWTEGTLRTAWSWTAPPRTFGMLW